MRFILTSLLLGAGLLLSACPGGNDSAAGNTSVSIPGGSAKGFVIGTDFDGKPLTIGKGALEGRGVYITYFATW